LRHSNGTRVDFEFQKFGRQYPNHAYNIPRPQFDQLVKNRAVELGAKFVKHRAKFITKSDHDKEISLDEESCKAANFSRSNEPDLIVDATGRTRSISRVLNISAQHGPRHDVAHFAHYKNFNSDSQLPGQVVLSVLKRGWAWQIPLAEHTSVGVVIDQGVAADYGSGAAERLENIILDNPLLRIAACGSERISPAKTYSNYQLISKQASGPGWLLLGDALGFVDPMLSPGVFMALESASLADQHVFNQQPHSYADFKQKSSRYFDEIKQWHCAWNELIQYFYDGRILCLGEQRSNIRNARNFSLSRIAEPIVSRTLAKMVGGIATRSKFNQAALRHTCRHLIKHNEDLLKYRIESGHVRDINIAA
jgi:flavin-dependent dehydrogenase